MSWLAVLVGGTGAVFNLGDMHDHAVTAHHVASVAFWGAVCVAGIIGNAIENAGQARSRLTITKLSDSREDASSVPRDRAH